MNLLFLKQRQFFTKGNLLAKGVYQKKLKGEKRMLKNITRKVEKKGNYTVNPLSMAELGNMTQSEIIEAAAVIQKKNRMGIIEVVSVKNKSILEQAICPLPEVNVGEINTIVRYVNVLPNGQPLISYFGATPGGALLASLITLAKTAKDMNGGVFSGYATLTSALGEEKHILPGTTVHIQKGIENIRVLNKDEMIFTLGTSVKKMTVENFIDEKWETAVLVSLFETKVLFLDRIQNGITNVVTENKIIQGYNLLTRKAATIQEQDNKHKVLSFVQWHKNAAVIATPLGLTKEPAQAFARVA